MKALNVGIIGYGRIGNEHAAWIDVGEGTRVAAVFDPTPARRELAARRGYRAVDKIESLLEDESIDAVLVSTPTSMHADHATQALLAGKDVMVEKPMALDLAQAKSLADLAKERKRTLSIFHCRRWDVDYLTVRDAVASGVFGKVINIESRLGQFASCIGPAAKEYRPNWRNEGAFGGGGLFDWGSHFVDQLWQLFLPAKPVRVFAQLRGNVWSKDCDDFARVCLDFDNGGVGLCEINTTTTRPLPRWHIDGTRGSASAPHSLAFETQKWAELTFTDVEGAERRLPTAKPGLSETAIWQRFAAACRGEAEVPVSVDSVLLTMRLLDAARESSASGKVVNV